MGRVVVFLICVPIMAICGAASNILNSRMIARLNRQLPSDRQFHPIWWHAGNFSQFNAEYRRIVGQDDLYVWRRRAIIGGFGALIVAAVTMFLR
jgi:hypothetical protein